MLIKERQPNEAIALLEERIKKEWRNRKALEREIRNIRSGDKSEDSAAYFINFEYRNSDNWAILHDLRIEHNGRVAQIDHMLINRWLDIYVLESKSFTTQLKITEHGEFERYISDDDTWEAIESPLTQNKRHIAVLEELLAGSNLLPRRLGMQLKPIYRQIVLVNGKGTITRPPSNKFDTSRVVKGDDFKSVIEREINSLSTMSNLKAIAQIISSDTLRELSKGIAGLHTPSRYSGSSPALVAASVSHPTVARIEPTMGPAAHPETSPIIIQPQMVSPTCKTCKLQNLEIAYGKFGYYWKCLDACGGNTKIVLPGPGKLRKAGSKFFYVAPNGSETLFFENSTVARAK